MKAVCPNNPAHDTFITTAHVAESWLVDNEGNFVSRVSSDEVVAKPHPDNIWTCNECGAEAEVSYD